MSEDSSTPHQRRGKTPPSPPPDTNSDLPPGQTIATARAQSPFEITEPLRPKRGIRTIFAAYDLHPDFPPTLAQFTDQLPQQTQREQAFANFKRTSIKQLWSLEDHRQRVLKQFPRAFEHDLTPAEQRHVQWLFELEDDQCCSLQTKLLMYFALSAILLVIIFWYTAYGINLFFYLHTFLLSLMSPDQTADSRPSTTPTLYQVLSNPTQYSTHHANTELLQTAPTTASKTASAAIQFDETEEIG